MEEAQRPITADHQARGQKTAIVENDGGPAPCWRSFSPMPLSWAFRDRSRLVPNRSAESNSIELSVLSRSLLDVVNHRNVRWRCGRSRVKSSGRPLPIQFRYYDGVRWPPSRTI